MQVQVWAAALFLQASTCQKRLENINYTILKLNVNIHFWIWKGCFVVYVHVSKLWKCDLVTDSNVNIITFVSKSGIDIIQLAFCFTAAFFLFFVFVFLNKKGRLVYELEFIVLYDHNTYMMFNCLLLEGV